MKSTEADDTARILVHRRENFAVKIELHHDELWSPHAVLLSVTTNGSQWEPTLLLPEEIDRVIAALQKAKKMVEELDASVDGPTAGQCNEILGKKHYK